jgi:hypothetical protein
MTEQAEQTRHRVLDAASALFRQDGPRERAAPLVAVVSGAARAEPELADLLVRLHAERRRNLRMLVDALAANGPLRVSGNEAVETVWALTSPELHQLLVRVGGWKRRRYANWLAANLSALLLTRLDM